jgi:hypothetical protein
MPGQFLILVAVVLGRFGRGNRHPAHLIIDVQKQVASQRCWHGRLQAAEIRDRFRLEVRQYTNEGKTTTVVTALAFADFEVAFPFEGGKFPGPKVLRAPVEQSF